MTNSFPPMRDEAAVSHLTRTAQRDGTVCYFFGDTAIRAVETQAAGKMHLIPIAGDQVACGEWVELDEEQVCRYCELLTRHLNSGEPNSMDAGWYQPDFPGSCADLIWRRERAEMPSPFVLNLRNQGSQWTEY